MYNDLNFREYWAVLRRRKWPALIVFIVFFTVITILTFTAEPVYKATAGICIESPFSQLNPQEHPVPGGFEEGQYIRNQIIILKSDVIAREVISRLHLNSQYGDPKMMHKFMSRLVVTQPTKYNNFVNISFESNNPELAANVVNETVRAFMRHNLLMKSAPARRYMDWLNSELGRINGSVGKSVSGLESFKENKEITGRIPVMSMRYLTSKVIEAEARRSQAEIKWRQAQELANKPEALMSLPEVIKDPGMQRLKLEVGELARLTAESSRKYGEKNPHMVRLRSRMDALNTQLQKDAASIVASLKNNYEQALRSEQDLRKALAHGKSDTVAYEKNMAEYALRRLDVSGTRDTYARVLKAFQESSVMGDISAGNIELVEEVSAPKMPVRPNKTLNIIVGLIFGIITGVGSAFIFERLDETFRVPEELEKQLGLAILGIVPKSSMRDIGPCRAKTVTDLMSPFSESYRTIRGNLLLSGQGRNPRIIQVCSAYQREGKSIIAANLACAMAAAGEKTLLIDADLRKPALHSLFKISNTQGLGSVLSSNAGVDDVIKTTRFHNLSLITAGPSSPRPGELLGSPNALRFINAMRERFDRILIDCPSYPGNADSSYFLPYSDGVIVVVRSGKTNKRAVMKTKKSLEVKKADILGVVLNDLKQSSLDSYYHYPYINYLSNEASEHTSEKVFIGART